MHTRGGIGLSTAKLLAQHGCSIAVHHSSESSRSKADELVSELRTLGGEGVNAAAFEADLSSYENAKGLYDRVVSVLGHPDILFGNHGAAFKHIGPSGDIQDVSFEMFEETWRLNMGTNYYVRVTFLPYLSFVLLNCDSSYNYAYLTWKPKNGAASSSHPGPSSRPDRSFLISLVPTSVAARTSYYPYPPQLHPNISQ